MNQNICNSLISASVGIMLFFTVAVAPSIFKVLPAEWAAKYVRAFFPKYYLALSILTTTACFFANNSNTLIVLLGCAGVLFFCFTWLTPSINQARDLEFHRRFQVLHALSVLLNLTVMLTFVGVLFLAYTNLPPI